MTRRIVPRLLRLPEALAVIAAGLSLWCTAVQARPVQPAPSGDVLPVLARLGLTPEALAASGFTGSQAATMTSRIQAAETLRAALEVQDYAAHEAVQALSELAGALVEAPADEELVAARQSALADLAAAQQQAEQLCASMFALAHDGLPSEQVGRLVTQRTNRAHAVPAEYRALDLTDLEWRALKRALRAEARALRLDEELDESHAQLLADVRADLAVITAESDLQANLASMQAVFDALPQD